MAIGVLSALAAAGNPGATHNALTPAEANAGFALLFDGANTGMWTLNWEIRDSAMYSPSSGTMIYTREEFSSFEWKVDFKVNAGGNSGLFIRTSTDWFCDGFEVGILDSKAGADADERSHPDNGDKLPAGIFNVNKGTAFVAGSNAPIKRSGAIYDIYPTTKDGIPISAGGIYVDRMKTAMEWNTMVVWANGNRIETWLNGMKVTDFEIGSGDYMDRFHRSKFGKAPNQCGDDYGKLAKGRLAVQDHGSGHRIWMRNIKIRSFEPGSKLPKPLAAPAGGAFPGPVKVRLDAGITGAAIRYTLDGSEPAESSPLYGDSTGVTIGASAVLKARTFRAGFAPSDAATAAFTVLGTGIQAEGKAGKVVPEAFLHRRGRRLLLASRNGISFTANLVALDGRKVLSQEIGVDAVELSLMGLEPGVYLIDMRAGTWRHGRRIALP